MTKGDQRQAKFRQQEYRQPWYRLTATRLTTRRTPKNLYAKPLAVSIFGVP
jgi:hypothetical protein